MRTDRKSGLTAGGGMVLGMIFGIAMGHLVLGMVFGLVLGALLLGCDGPVLPVPTDPSGR